MGFQKGNKLAVKNKIWTEAIKRAIRQEYGGQEWEQALKDAALPLVQAAKNGDMTALKEIGDRLEGKPHQTSEVTVNRVTNLDDLPTDELERIAFRGRDDTASEAGGVSEHSPIH